VNILWLKTELLHPVDKGGKIRTYHMLKELKRNHHITYVTLDDGTADEEARKRASEYCHKLVCIPHGVRPKFTAGFYAELAQNLVSRLPYAIKKYESAKMRREIEERTRSGAFDVLVCDFLAPSVNVPPQRNCPSILFQHNVESLIWKRHYQSQADPLKKAYLYFQWLKMRRFERKVCSTFDSIVAVSRDDRELMQQDYQVQSVFDVPTGVDTGFFFSNGDAPAKPNSLVFTGSMDWLPNEDAINHFTQDILPLIRKAVPDVSITIVGRSPSRRLQELGQRDPSITVTGRVDDVRPFMRRAAAYIVPLRIGGGTRLKIFEAMAMAKAVVSTTIGAEGLPVSNGVELLLADTPQEFAQAVVRLLTDRDFATEMAQRAAATVRREFSWDKVAESFAAICQTAVEKRRKQHI
jgi:sugar transferase (PEP-CTERM/EpsH1 system associated)